MFLSDASAGTDTALRRCRTKRNSRPSARLVVAVCNESETSYFLWNLSKSALRLSRKARGYTWMFEFAAAITMSSILREMGWAPDQFLFDEGHRPDHIHLTRIFLT